MADCSYARCLQERRSIKRELQRWTKNMVYVVGLERVAEELMGRRKWKLYQDVLLARNHPLQQSEQSDSPVEPTSTENRDISDTQDLNSQENQPQEEEGRSMIATTEALQRNNSATDLTQDPADQTTKKELEKQTETPIVSLDEDSKDAKEANPSEDGPSSLKEDNCSVQPTTLKIKTIEEINTVGKNDGNSGATETILESLIKRSSTGPPRKPQPSDWRPQDKCYFCVDGELVKPGAEPQPAAPEQPLSPPAAGESGSESGSSRSGPSPAGPLGVPGPGVQPAYLLNQQAQALAHLIQLQQNRHPTMNQVQSMAASLAAVAALGSPGMGGLPSLPHSLVPQGLLPPHWYLQQRQERPAQQERVTPPRGSPPVTSEQPLDLSARPSGGAGPPSPSALEARLAGLRGAPIDPKLFNRAKPRLAPTGGRRAYSEAELQMALRDIQSGRLGTRRAAVIYNIPRSTLRNKVYKLAVEREREARLPGQQISGAADRADDSNDITDEVDDDKDSVMEEDKEEEREPPRPLLSMEDILRYSQMENPSYGQSENLRSLLQKGQKFYDLESPKREAVPEPWPTPEQNVNNYIQTLLMASGLQASIPKPEENNSVPMMPEIVRLLAEERHNILKEQLMKREHLNNGKQNELSEDDSAMNKRILSRQSSSASSVITKNDRMTPVRKTESPEDEAMEVEHMGGESRDSPSNVILKIPSFKPVQGASSGKNGGEAFSGPATPPHPTYFSRSPHQDISPVFRPLDRFSPSLGHMKGMFSLKDVIAKSISQKFQQHGPPSNHNSDLSHLKVNSTAMDAMESLHAFKRGGMTPPVGQGISVIKNLTTHDLTRSFGSNNSGSQNQQNNSVGGKGTRPKRGKYRNYDRDSLVEAVKAVQRGEMSVHRAGSYYGVPHSTLEYKVKERHLMRPRKRELKNPNPDDKLQAPSASKPTDIPGANVLRSEKPKIMQKPPTKPNFPASSPNGLKMPPIFDGSSLGLGYNPSPFPFWPHAPPFPGLPVEFPPRNPGTSATFPPNTESFFASQMMQRLQEESARHPGPARKDPLLDSAREMAELYEGASGANGSFLEGIIRSTLDRPGQRSGSGEGDAESGESGRRRLRPDDLLLAEEMREAARRLRAREASAPTPPTQPHPS